MFSAILMIPSWLMFILFFMYGSILGSFANVLIYRMQKQSALNLFKRSYCPKCSYSIPFYLNIPIFSWFLLRGACRNCGGVVSLRYPLVEFLMALICSFLFLAIGWKWFLLEAIVFSLALLVASFIDWDQMILPDSLTLSGLFIGLLGAWLNPERAFLPALSGAVLGGGLLLFIAFSYYLLRKKEGMGGGDVKMLAWIGAVLGWESLFFVMLSSCFFGGLFGLGMMLQGNKKILQTVIPFGPYLAFSALLYIFLNYWTENFLSFFRPFSVFLDFPLQ